MKEHIDMNKLYWEYDIDTFEYEDEINDICLALYKEGVDQTLIDRVSELGRQAKQTLLKYQTLNAAVGEVCDKKEMGFIENISTQLEFEYDGRMPDEESIKAIENYAPGFLDANQDAVLLKEEDIKDYFAHGKRLWCLDTDGRLWEPKAAEDALEFMAEGGLVVTSAYMAEKLANEKA